MADKKYAQAEYEHVTSVMQPSTPVKWTPEDAANLISSAIREAQRPAVLAIKRRGVSKLVYFLTCIILLAMLGGALYYFAWLKENEWKVETAKLESERSEIQKKYDSLLEGKFAGAAKITSDVVDNHKLREQLDDALRNLGASKAEIEKLSVTLKGVRVNNEKLEEQLIVLKKSSNVAEEELTKRKAEIENIEALKEGHQQSITKLQKLLSLQKTANTEQSKEIEILRQRLKTAQEMVGNLGDSSSNSSQISDY